MVVIRLGKYLDELKSREDAKTGTRLRVPTVPDISKDTGIHYTTLNRIARGRSKRLDFQTADKIIKSMRKRGFDMKMTDLIDFQED